MNNDLIIQQIDNLQTLLQEAKETMDELKEYINREIEANVYG